MIELRPLVEADWSTIARIYREGIESGHATFETDVPEWAGWDASRLTSCRIVAQIEDELVGFAALSPVSKRPVYAGVAEVMVYVAADRRGAGVGAALMSALVAASEEAGIWTLQASIFPENEASIRAHERVGFRRVGVRERIARHGDRGWRDTVILERRSDRVG